MITVVGVNTAIDHFVAVDALQVGAVNRATAGRLLPGGKGLHVAQTIAALGEPVRLIGLIDVANQSLIARHLAERGVLLDAVPIDGPLRHCIAVREADGRITEVLGQGPQLGEAERTALYQAFRRSLADSALVVLSGSLPPGLSTGTYAGLVREAHLARRRCLVDASGELLRQAIGVGPYLVKPNRDEAATWSGRPIDSLDAAVAALRELAARGVETPALSLGDQGALAADDGGIWHAVVVVDDVRNTVGSGDCFLGGFAVATARGESLPDALRLAVACGAANAMEEETGFVRRERVEALLQRVRVQAWSP